MFMIFIFIFFLYIYVLHDSPSLNYHNAQTLCMIHTFTHSKVVLDYLHDWIQKTRVTRGFFTKEDSTDIIQKILKINWPNAWFTQVK